MIFGYICSALMNQVMNTVFHFLFQKTYKIGFDIQSTNPREATEEFMKREFSEILKWKTKPHDALLIPDSFVYGGIAAKVNNLLITLSLKMLSFV
jgi:hypothetical protein